MAKSRARRAALLLHEMSFRHDRLAVFGHGMMSLHVAKALREIGWRGAARPLGYWSTIRLQLASRPIGSSDRRE